MKSLPVLNVSPGNSKTGRIPSISGIPGKDCAKWTRAYCGKKCYALKSWKQYPNVRNAWGNNSKLLRTNKREYFKQLHAYLDKRKPKYFRFHVSGDIVNAMHAGFIVDTARRYPDIKFLIFTKKYDVLKYMKEFPNLSVVVSVWQGMKAKDLPSHTKKYSKAYAGDCSNFKGYKNAIECPGNCETCLACWGLGKKKLDVKFELH